MEFFGGRGVGRRVRAVLARARDGLRMIRRRARFLANRGRRSGDTALIRAVRAGNVARVQQLAISGVPLDATNARGQTALHLAATLGRAEIAACLLAHGADHELRDARGRAPLGSEVNDIEVLHSIRQHYQRFPYPAVQADSLSDPVVRDAIAELRASGIVRVPGVIGPQLLTQLRTDFAGFIDELESRVETDEAHDEHYDQEMYYWSVDLAYITNNAFKHAASLARLACSSPIVDIVRMYLAKPAFIQRALATRYLPADISGHGMFRYHHDLVDQRLKVMVLLTDVGEGDQYLSYIRGSQTLFHPYRMFRSNACPLEYCERRLGRVDIFRTIGRAGDMFLFDSNGAHMGNRRSTGSTRDAFFVEFSAARSPQFGGDIPAEIFEQMPIVESHPLYVMANSRKAWERPNERGSRPSWIVDLPRPETWVWHAPQGSSVAKPISA